MNNQKDNCFLHRYEQRILFFLLLFFMIKSIIWLFIFPVFQTPDENRHYDYILHLAKLKHFPQGPLSVGRDDWLMQETLDLQKMARFESLVFHAKRKTTFFLSDDSLQVLLEYYQETDLATNHQDFQKITLYSYPPLYYLIGSGAYLGAKAIGFNIVERFYAVRSLSIIIGLFCFVLIYRILVILKFPLFVRFSSMLFLMLWPQLSLFFVSTCPDVLALLVILAVTFLVLQSKPNNFKYFWVGFLIGVLGFIKFQYFATTFAGIYLVRFVQHKYLFRKYDWKLVKSMVVSVAMCSVWVIHNFITYHGLQPHYDGLASEQNTIFHRVELFYLLLKGITRESYIGKLGWLDTTLPGYVYYGFLFLILIGVGCFVYMCVRWAVNNHSIKQLFQTHSNYLFIFAPFFIFVTLMVLIAVFMSPLLNFQGRYYFPYILAQILIFIYYPWQIINNKKAATLYLALVNLFMVIIHVQSILVVIERYYGV